MAVVPFLWFDGQAEEAARFYVGVFPGSRIDAVTRTPPGVGGAQGEVLTVDFTLDGQPFVALNAGPRVSFTEAISFQIPCADQAEVDRYWSLLTADGGRESACGWLADRFGLSWQVTPTVMNDLLGDPDRERAARAFRAMQGMGKLDIAALLAAADGA